MFASRIVSRLLYDVLSATPGVTDVVGDRIVRGVAYPQNTQLPALLFYMEQSAYSGPLGTYQYEHILGEAWPSLDVRLEMLEEAVGLIRELWQGDFVNHRGRFYTADTARIYTLPDAPPPRRGRAARHSALPGRAGAARPPPRAPRFQR